MKAIGYIRVSTDEQAASGLGLEAQREQIRAYAKLRGLELAGVITEAGISAGIPFAQRPGGAEVLRAIDAGTTAVVVLKLDRAFRNTVDALETVTAWDKRGVGLHVLDLGGNAVDTRSASGRFLLTVLAALGEMERLQIGERTASALGSKRARGEKTGGGVPFGFVLSADGRALIPCPKEGGTAKKIIRMRKRGKSLRAIAERLNLDGIRTKGGAEWKASQVKAAAVNWERFKAARV